MIKKLLKILIYLFLFLLLVVAAGLLYVVVAFPRVAPVEDIQVELTAERIERGRYLSENVAGCFTCHAERDWSRYAGPVVEGTKGKGAVLDTLDPAVHSANITPFALGDMSDGELLRSMASGIDREGRALHFLMPYDAYAKMTREDLYAVIAYLRSLPSIEHEPPKPKLGFPGSLVADALPKPYEPPPALPVGDNIARGRYLWSVAQCGFCHGQKNAGGKGFRIPGGERVLASNITPATDNRFGSWSRENFIGVFKSFAGGESQDLPGAAANTVMPWLVYAGMTEEDLGALYDFLRTFEPVAALSEPSGAS